jgi:MFS family permease
MPLLNYSYLEKILTKPKFKKPFKEMKFSFLVRVRLATSLFFFGMGFCFSSWASRIPDIKSYLNLSEAELGSMLFALPIGQLIAMPFSGKIVAQYGSKIIAIYGLILYAICLTLLGLASHNWELAIGLFLFGFFGNFCNIAVNTQGVHTQQLFEKPIMGSFHGSWSLAGFVGALMGLLMVSMHLNPFYHFLIVLGIIGIIILTNQSFLVKSKKEKSIPKTKSSLFSIPDKKLIWLGVISFCCMASEGIMFDWSGVYFKDIVKAPGALVVLGYASFMVTMAIGRFLSDVLVGKFGPKNILIISGIIISVGLYMAVLFPYLISCTIAFMLVGFGVSNVIPIVFNTAGTFTNVPTSIALTIISSISFMGFLIGPPMIGFIAELTSLKYSFAIIGLFGIFISFLSYKLKLFK